MTQNDKLQDTVFCDEGEKVKFLKLSADSAAMGYAACLKSEISPNTIPDIKGTSQAYVFQNTIYVLLLQTLLVFLIWKAYTDDQYEVNDRQTLELMAARFIAAMMMHLNVEKDVRNGISMMKYAVNHY